MKNTALEVVEQNDGNEKVLIVDRTGRIAEPLSEKLRSGFDVYLVSQNSPNISEINFIAFRGKIPVIPNNYYSQIIVVYDRFLYESGQIWEFIKKAKTDNSKIIFLLSIYETVSPTLTEKIIDQYNNSRIVFFGDIFPFPHYSPVNNILREAVENKEIKINEPGLDPLYPVPLSELTEGVIEVFFGLGKSKIYFVFPKSPPTELSFARTLQRLEPFLKVDFIKKEDIKRENKISLPKEGTYLEKNLWEKEIKEAFDNFPKNKAVQKKENKNNYSRFFKFGLIYMLFIFLLLPLLAPLFFGVFGLMELKGAKNSLESGNFEAAKKEAKASETFFSLSLSSSSPLLFEANLIGQNKAGNLLVEKISLGRDFSEVIFYASDAFLGFKNVLAGKDAGQNFAKASNSLRRVLEISQNNRVKDLENFEPILKIIINTQEAYPSLLGFEGKKDYLLLFQNNMELRPGGGFIGSYALASLNKGKIEDFKIHDVYDADGQLKGHVEPPFAIRRYLPSVHWYLRDSNFDVDFRKNASMAAFFLKEEMGKNVDGVIGLDVTFVKNILAALGPIYVPDYKENVSSDNLYLLTQTHAEKNFFPGSSQKKDFLNALFNAILAKISTSKEIPYIKLLMALEESALGKHILFASADPHIQSVFDINNLSSSIKESKNNQDLTVEDFLGISEANLGVNKANYFVRRKVSQQITIDELGNLNGRLTLKYKNTAAENIWPGGDYRNYLRIILPQNATITSVAMDDKNLSLIPAVLSPSTYEAKDFKPAEGLEIERTEEEGKTIYGFLVTVPVGELKTLTISYSLSQKAPINLSSFKYNFLFFKQPGTEEYPFDFSISIPSFYNVVSRSSDLLQEENTLSFSNNIFTDKEFNAEFAKK